MNERRCAGVAVAQQAAAAGRLWQCLPSFELQLHASNLSSLSIPRRGVATDKPLYSLQVFNTNGSAPAPPPPPPQPQSKQKPGLKKVGIPITPQSHTVINVVHLLLQFAQS
jgi:hypothetical protein